MRLKVIIHACCPAFSRPFLDRIESSDIGYRLAKGVFWLTAGAVISRGLMLLASIFVARLLGKSGYGELGMIQSTVSMFSIFAGFGLGLTATKHVAELRESDPVRAGRIIVLSGRVAFATGGLVAAGLLIFAPWIAERTINAPHLAGVLRIGALMLFISALNGAQTGALSGFEAFGAIARVSLFAGLLSFPILVCGACFGGLTGAVWGLTINLGINWILNHHALRKEARRYAVPLFCPDCGHELPVLWKFSLPAVFSGSMVLPITWLCNTLLVRQADGYGELGLFNAAIQWQTAILFLPGMVSYVVLPMLSNLNGRDERTRYLAVLKYNILINGGAALFLAASVALSARWIMSWYGAGFAQGAWVLVCVSVTTVLISVNNVIGQAIVSKGHMWIGFVFNLLWAISLVSSAIFLFSAGYGASGLAAANLLAYLLHCIWQGGYLNRLIKVP